MTTGRRVNPANKKGGRPSHEPDDVTRATVMAMAGYGVPEADIAKVIRIDPKTLRKHYRDELDTGHIRANAKVAQSLYEQATTGNVTAAIWWSKCRMGWSETNRDEGGAGALAKALSEFAQRAPV